MIFTYKNNKTVKVNAQRRNSLANMHIHRLFTSLPVAVLLAEHAASVLHSLMKCRSWWAHSYIRHLRLHPQLLKGSLNLATNSLSWQHCRYIYQEYACSMVLLDYWFSLTHSFSIMLILFKVTEKPGRDTGQKVGYTGGAFYCRAHKHTLPHTLQGI